jgi:hypothetical protein
MKNIVVILLAVVAFSTGCNKDKFIEKLIGAYTVNSYIKDNKDQTNQFKADKADYTLDIAENNVFTESYLINGLVYKQTTGEWQLINSSKDLQLVDTDNKVRMFNIVKMSGKEMTLEKGNEQFQFIEK